MQKFNFFHYFFFHFKVVAAETGTYTSHKYIRGKEFDRPSPGVIVPGHLEGDDRIQWLMDNDPAFKRLFKSFFI